MMTLHQRITKLHVRSLSHRGVHACTRSLQLARNSRASQSIVDCGVCKCQNLKLRERGGSGQGLDESQINLLRRANKRLATAVNDILPVCEVIVAKLQPECKTATLENKNKGPVT